MRRLCGDPPCLRESSYSPPVSRFALEGKPLLLFDRKADFGIYANGHCLRLGRLCPAYGRGLDRLLPMNTLIDLAA
jgi:hypothetical protein